MLMSIFFLNPRVLKQHFVSLLHRRLFLVNDEILLDDEYIEIESGRKYYASIICNNKSGLDFFFLSYVFM